MAMRKYHERSRAEWDAAIEEIEKKCYTRAEAKELYKAGKIKKNELFCVKGAATARGPVWMCAAFVGVKPWFTYVHYLLTDAALSRKKRLGIAHIMEQIELGFIDGRQAGYLPARLQSVNNPDLKIYGANSAFTLQKTLGGDGKKQVKEVEEVIEEVKDITPDIA